MRYLLALLACLGLAVSAMALRVHYSHDVEPCDINAHWDCGVVNHSRFAVVYGVPVAAIGIAGYALLAGLALARQRTPLLLCALGGLAYALYLTHIERDLLQVWCLYCVCSQCIIALLALGSAGWLIASRRSRPRGAGHAAAAGA